jgi:hypothetical protein
MLPWTYHIDRARPKLARFLLDFGARFTNKVFAHQINSKIS